MSKEKKLNNVRLSKKGSFTDKLTAFDLFYKTAKDGNSGSHFCSKALYINLKSKDIYIYIYTHQVYCSS